jgi:hypothetical protein
MNSDAVPAFLLARAGSSPLPSNLGLDFDCSLTEEYPPFFKRVFGEMARQSAPHPGFHVEE